MGVRQTIRNSERLVGVVASNRRRLIASELDLASTLCDLAETECRRHDFPHAGELVSKARRATDDIRRIVRQAAAGELQAINASLEELETRARHIQSKVEKQG